MRDSKITFRVSDDLLERVDEIDESRSEIMRDALRRYLEGGAGTENSMRGAREPRKTEAARRVTLDEVVRTMVEEVVEERADSQDNVNVTVNVPEGHGSARAEGTPRRQPAEGVPEPPADADEDTRKTCAQCGEELDDSHVYCPNCGEKAAQRVFCDCGDEIRSDWSFCPSCGRRTPASHALNR